MCGRYVQATPLDLLLTRFRAAQVRGPIPPPRFNVSPGTRVPAVLAESGTRVLTAFLWGLVPSWSRDPSGHRPINARAETVAEKPMFRGPLRRSRALVPADGFYEWSAAGSHRTPHFFRLAGGRDVLALAALWDRWSAPGAEPLETVALVTTAAVEPVRAIHERMPVLLDEEGIAVWLQERPLTPVELDRCLRPPPEGALEGWEVGPLVNSPRNDGPGLLEPLGPACRDSS